RRGQWRTAEPAVCSSGNRWRSMDRWRFRRGGMRFRVLGPVALHAEEWLVPGPGLRCTLLGTLLAARSSAVSADALVETMWGEVPGDGAHARLQVHVHRDRKSTRLSSSHVSV